MNGSMLPIAIIQMGLPPAGVRRRVGDQADWFCAALGVSRSEVLIADPSAGEPLPGAATFSVAIVTGSWCMVTDRADWSERTGAWLTALIAGEKPVFGVCYGHQLMAQAMGGRVDYLPGGREQGAFEVELDAAAASDPLFGAAPHKFTAYLSHLQSVLAPPPSAVVLGGTARDRFQILRYGPHALSVQFHPDFTPEVLRACIAERVARTPGATEAVPDAAELPQSTVPRALLRRFVALHCSERLVVSV